MNDPLAMLYFGAAAFVGLHLLPSAAGWRRGLVRVLGQRGYALLYSLVSVVTLVWLVWAYARMPVGVPLLWASQPLLRVAAAVLVAGGFILVVCAVTIANPTAVGAERALRLPDPARGIVRVTRHPMMWGVALWGIAHLLNRNDIGAVVLFGSLTLLALAGTVSIDRKKKELLEGDWARFAAVTSNLPFVAILQGRNRLALGEIGWWRPLLGLALFVAFYGVVHTWLFGVSPLP